MGGAVMHPSYAQFLTYKLHRTWTTDRESTDRRQLTARTTEHHAN